MAVKYRYNRDGHPVVDGVALRSDVPNRVGPTAPTDAWNQLSDTEKARLLKLQFELGRLHDQRIQFEQALQLYAAAHYTRLGNELEATLLSRSQRAPSHDATDEPAHELGELVPEGVEDVDQHQPQKSTDGLTDRVEYCRAVAAMHREQIPILMDEENFVFPCLNTDENNAPISELEALELVVRDSCETVDYIAANVPLGIPHSYVGDEESAFTTTLAAEESAYIQAAKDAIEERMTGVDAAMNDFLELHDVENGVGYRFAKEISSLKSRGLTSGTVHPYRSDKILAIAYFLDGVIQEGTTLDPIVTSIESLSFLS